jgi:hypothetical protein
MRVTYRTRDGEADYEFSLEEQGGRVWRAYIVSQPSYQSRDRSLQATHRLIDEQGRYYVCWSTPVRELDDLKRIAALWSDRTQRYIKDGTPVERS